MAPGGRRQLGHGHAGARQLGHEQGRHPATGQAQPDAGDGVGGRPGYRRLGDLLDQARAQRPRAGHHEQAEAQKNGPGDQGRPRRQQAEFEEVAGLQQPQERHAQQGHYGHHDDGDAVHEMRFGVVLRNQQGVFVAQRQGGGPVAEEGEKQRDDADLRGRVDPRHDRQGADADDLRRGRATRQHADLAHEGVRRQGAVDQGLDVHG